MLVLALLLLGPGLSLAAPGKPLIMSFSSRSVLLSWTPSMTPVTQYRVRVRQGEEGAWPDARTVATGSNSSEFNITGLRPFTVYSFKVVSVMELGEEEESEASYYMITLREAPSGMPTITSAYNTSSRYGRRRPHQLGVSSCLPLTLYLQFVIPGLGRPPPRHYTRGDAWLQTWLRTKVHITSQCLHLAICKACLHQ